MADELSATTLAELPQDRLVGVVVRDGAANSHAAIMVRALGIPTVDRRQFGLRCCIVDADR
ncbi:PEP-utilizing enzyme [Escherichia coli]